MLVERCAGDRGELAERKVFPLPTLQDAAPELIEECMHARTLPRHWQTLAAARRRHRAGQPNCPAFLQPRLVRSDAEFNRRANNNGVGIRTLVTGLTP